MTVFFFWAAVGALLFLGVGAVAAALMGKTPFQSARDSTLTVLSYDYSEIDRDREAGLLSEKDGEAAKDDVRRATLQREAAEHKPSTVKPSDFTLKNAPTTNGLGCFTPESAPMPAIGRERMTLIRRPWL